MNAYLTKDRLGNAKSALSLSNGFFRIRSNLTFGMQFSITAWIRLKSLQRPTNLIEMNSGGSVDRFILNTYKTTGYLSFGSFDPIFTSIKTFSALKLNEWTHVALVLQNMTAFVYLNGVLDTVGVMHAVRNVTRSVNFIGSC